MKIQVLTSNEIMIFIYTLNILNTSEPSLLLRSFSLYKIHNCNNGLSLAWFQRFVHCGICELSDYVSSYFGLSEFSKTYWL